jgi:branched-chain amino acid transport system substrate-binding protein
VLSVQKFVKVGALAAACAFAVAACGDDGGTKATATTTATATSGGSATTAAGGTATTTGTSSAAPTKSELVIGNVGQYSGPFGPAYQHGSNGLVAWTKWVNAHGGINGHPVRVVVKNDEGDAAKSIAAVKDLVENEHVLALVGNNAGGTDAAWKAYVEEKKIPVIGGLTTTAQYKNSPMFFAGTSNQIGFVTSEINSAKLAGGTKLATVVCGEQAACKEGIAIFESIAAKIPIPFVGGQTVSGAAPSFAAQCIALKGQGADVVVMNIAGPTVERMLKDCAQQNYKPKYVFTGGTFLNSFISADTEGSVITSGAPLWFGDQPAHKDWVDALKQYTDFAPDGFSSRTWQAGEMFKAAAKNVPDAPTSADILKGLYAFKDETLGGWSAKLNFKEGVPNDPIGACDFIAVIKGGALTAPFGYDCQPVKLSS